MTGLSQANIARALGTSAMTISRHVRAFQGEGMPLTDRTAILCFAVPEIVTAGFNVAVAIELLIEFDAEVKYLAEDPARRCWVAFVNLDEDGNEARFAALRSASLEVIVDRHPISLILPLHVVVSKAAARLAAAKEARKDAA